MHSAARLVLVFAASSLMACGSSSSQAPAQAPASVAEQTPPPVAEETPVAVAPAVAAQAVAEPDADSEPPEPELVAPGAPGQAGATGSEQPRQAAILGTLSAQPGGAFASLTGTADFSSGLDESNVFGGLIGQSTATVELKVASTTGAVDTKTAASVLEMAHAQFQSCGNGDLKGEPLKAGTPFQLKFRIGPKGNTSAVSLTGASKGVSKCLTNLVRKLQFQENKKPTKVSATITFVLDEAAVFGAGGLGLSGTGRGGGGTGMGTIGLGSYGTIGHSSGGGSGYGTGRLGGGNRPPQVIVGNPVSVGALDKNIIRRYIRRHLPRVRYCYEKELLTNPKLTGTVTVKFEILPDGSVTNVDAKGLGPAVSNCVGQAIRTVRFPKPQGGGSVTVRYPFTFKPSK